VIDFVGGKADLERKSVRAIGDARARFTEDKLRLLRCVRLASELQFAIEPNTFEAVRVMAAEINIVSAERVRDELNRIFTSEGAGRGLRLLDESGLLQHILPEVAAMKGVAQPPQFHPEGDVWTHVCMMMDAVGRLVAERQAARGKRHEAGNEEADAMERAGEERFLEELAWAVLLHDVGKPVTFEVTKEKDGSERIRFNGHDAAGVEIGERVLRRLGFPNDVMFHVLDCVDNHMRFKDAPNMRKGKIKDLIARPTFPVELELHRIDCESSNRILDVYDFLKQRMSELSIQEVRPQPLLTGRDLLAMGFREGPMLGQILDELRELQLEEKLTTSDEARAWVEQNHLRD